MCASKKPLLIFFLHSPQFFRSSISYYFLYLFCTPRFLSRFWPDAFPHIAIAESKTLGEFVRLLMILRRRNFCFDWRHIYAQRRRHFSANGSPKVTEPLDVDSRKDCVAGRTIVMKKNFMYSFGQKVLSKNTCWRLNTFSFIYDI